MGNILTGTTYNYWEHKGSRNEYQMGYSHFWKNLVIGLAFQSRDNEQQRRDDRFYVNFTLPLGERVQSPIFLLS